MTDYRELFGVSGIATETHDGEGIKVAVIDTGVPNISGILVSLYDNMTNSGIRDSGHATFVGSLLFGTGDVTGVCHGANACFIKVFDGLFAAPETVAKAILHATDQWHVDIINLSLGFSRSGECPEVLRKACDYACSKGVVIVASTGNDGGLTLWPAALKSVIGIGSSDSDAKAAFSNHGEVDFVVDGVDLEGYSTDGTVIKKSGTSFSTALISGLLALLMAKRRKLGLKTSVDLLKGDLKTICRDLEQYGYDSDTGYGIPMITSVSEHKLRARLMLGVICDKIMKVISLVPKTLGILIRREKDG